MPGVDGAAEGGAFGFGAYGGGDDDGEEGGADGPAEGEGVAVAGGQVRGFGLALVRDKLDRLRGTIVAYNDGGAVFDVQIVKPFTCATINAKLADCTSFRRAALAALARVGDTRADQGAIDRHFNLRHRSSALPPGLLAGDPGLDRHGAAAASAPLRRAATTTGLLPPDIPVGRVVGLASTHHEPRRHHDHPGYGR